MICRLDYPEVTIPTSRVGSDPVYTTPGIPRDGISDPEQLQHGEWKKVNHLFMGYTAAQDEKKIFRRNG